MLNLWWVQGGLAFLMAFLLGTLLEYFVHRLMHKGKLLGRKHAEHHRDGWGQGWLGEFSDYFLGSLVLVWVGFLYSVPAGIGWAAGGVIYAALAAYSHQLQHERPELVFWMPRPVHYLHHTHRMWKHNFGILVDWWDRVFGTYKKVEWNPEKRVRDYPLRSFLQISWLSYKEPETVEVHSVAPGKEEPTQNTDSTPHQAACPEKLSELAASREQRA